MKRNIEKIEKYIEDKLSFSTLSNHEIKLYFFICEKLCLFKKNEQKTRKFIENIKKIIDCSFEINFLINDNCSFYRFKTEDIESSEFKDKIRKDDNLGFKYNLLSKNYFLYCNINNNLVIALYNVHSNINVQILKKFIEKNSNIRAFSFFTNNSDLLRKIEKYFIDNKKYKIITKENKSDNYFHCCIIINSIF